MKTYYDDRVLLELIKDAERAYKPVSVTAGPKGRNVGLADGTITHDGVTVARSISEGQGVRLIQAAASKTEETVGDGTTTTTILTYHLLKEAHKLISAGHNPMDLKAELELMTTELLTKIEPTTVDAERVIEIATLSSASAELGQVIGDVVNAVGSKGIVSVEPWFETVGEVVKGYEFNSEPIMSDKLDNPLILITERKLVSLHEILPLLSKINMSGNKNLVIIAEDVVGDVLATIQENKKQGVFNTAIIKAPSYGEHRLEVLEDMAALTGATIITDFATAELSMLGTAQTVITGNKTAIIGGRDITMRIKSLETKEQTSFLQERIAALSGKVAVIKISADSPTALKEKIDRVNDAIGAAKASLDGGVVVGGAITYIELSNLLPTTPGALMLKNALVQPFKQLMHNAGFNPEAKLAGLTPGHGYDVHTGKLVDLHKVGIIDPANVVRESIKNAVAAAGLAMTMGAMFVE